MRSTGEVQCSVGLGFCFVCCVIYAVCSLLCAVCCVVCVVCTISDATRDDTDTDTGTAHGTAHCMTSHHIAWHHIVTLKKKADPTLPYGTLHGLVTLKKKADPTRPCPTLPYPNPVCNPQTQSTSNMVCSCLQ